MRRASKTDRQRYDEYARDQLMDAVWASFLGHWFEHDKAVDRVLRYVEATHEENGPEKAKEREEESLFELIEEEKTEKRGCGFGSAFIANDD